MSDQQQEVTIDDVWVNRLAQRIGVLTAQNERLAIEVESLTEQIKQLQQPAVESNGEMQGATP